MAPSIAEHLASGALSGFTSSTLLQPLDLLKTRQQQSLIHQRPTILGAARSVLQTDGPRGLWRGTSATLTRNIPGIALYMTSLSALRARLAAIQVFAAERSVTSTLPTLSPTGNLLAGASTRVAVGFILNPVSVLKARYESSLHQLPSLPAALAALARAGPRELTRGFWASSLRDAPYAGLFVLSYEGAKRWAGKGGNAGVLPGWAVHTASAAAAGTVATLATHPFDVIKTKIQVRSEAQFRGFVPTVRAVFQTRGVPGFFDGAGLRLTRKVLSSAIGWGVYEGVLVFRSRL